MVVENYGQEKWNEILQLSGVQETQFISNESYEDEITFELVAAASETLQLRQEDVLFAFGEYWILNTGHQKYGELMKAGGKDFLEFMKNLPNFHGRIMLIYPKLCPPEFLVEVENEKKNYITLLFSKKWTNTFCIWINSRYCGNVSSDH